MLRILHELQRRTKLGDLDTRRVEILALSKQGLRREAASLRRGDCFLAERDGESQLADLTRSSAAQAGGMAATLPEQGHRVHSARPAFRVSRRTRQAAAAVEAEDRATSGITPFWQRLSHNGA